MRPIQDIRDGVSVDLQDYVRLTGAGRRYLERLSREVEQQRMMCVTYRKLVVSATAILRRSRCARYSVIRAANPQDKDAVAEQGGFEPVVPSA